ncbi:TonB-dependent receptor domain-containing protein [Parafilimonas sp.]|uniref:TonB-dependent receptor domain-containing protein n=1 Tax=Parafilimonas sp. TaxID=1969739 RepID=UPI0039E6BA11
MKRIFIAAILSMLSTCIFAQFPGGGGKGKQIPGIGHIYGKVIDSAGKPVLQASVVLMQGKFDSASKKIKQMLFKGATTETNGEFSFGDLPLLGLTLKISAVGYKPYEQKISFQPKSSGGNAPAAGQNQQGGTQQMSNMMSALDKDLGDIKLQPDEANTLQTVTVTSTSGALKMDIDKKTFNVDKNIVSAGGTAVDVMKNVPSLQVDIDGNVKLRNATPQLYIDGRPTTLTLDEIPADAIQSVEVITNPSAKYDASGGNAGILNIILKKNKKTGYNGNIMAGVDSRGGYNAGGNFSVRQGKINLTAALMANSRRSLTKGTTEQHYYPDTLNIKDVRSFQNTESRNNGMFMFGRLGLDYFITNRTTLSVSGTKVHGEFKPATTSDISTDSNYYDHVVSLTGNRLSTSNRTFNGTGLQGGIVHNFLKDGHQLTADVNYFGGKNDGDQFITSNTFDSGGNFISTSRQRQLSDGKNSFVTIQTDYTNPITKNLKLEAGLRAQINKLDNNNQTYYVKGSELIKVPSAGIAYSNTNNVYAAYGTITSSIKNFGYQVGLRAERSDYTGVLNDTGHFANNYPISLFPSVFLSYKLGNRQELQANFSRRINRPNFFQLIPYTDRSDSLNITRGNPDLKPEFTNSFEASYSKTYGKNNTFLASIYYKHTKDLITSYYISEYNSSLSQTEQISTYENASSAYSYGLELTTVNYATKWWDFNLNVNLYKSKINTENLDEVSQDALLSWFGKWNNNFKLPANFTIQLSANYQSKTNLPVNQSRQMFGPPQSALSSSQGYIKPYWSADIAIKKTFFKNQAGALTLSVNDIFRTGANEQISYTEDFYQDYYRLNNPQLVRLNFSYRFGKMDVSLFKRQNKNQSSVDQSQISM